MTKAITCKEGRDYVTENGRVVFTREYLLTRGTCCGSGCRECPYKIAQAGSLKNETEERGVAWISFVPSWTETLIAAGLNVVGRTAYCSHPSDAVKSIPIVGGTKTLNKVGLQKAIEMQTDRCTIQVVLDQEENPREFMSLIQTVFDQSSRGRSGSSLCFHITHVTSLDSFACELLRLKEVSDLRNEQAAAGFLSSLVGRLVQVRAQLNSMRLQSRRIEQNTRAVYLVWRNPWIAVHRSTFIGDMIQLVYRDQLEPSGEITSAQERYPRLDGNEIEALNVQRVYLSTEPYDFGLHFEEASQELSEVTDAELTLLDGEKVSWFGLRAIRFLEDQLIQFQTGPR